MRNVLFDRTSNLLCGNISKTEQSINCPHDWRIKGGTNIRVFGRSFVGFYDEEDKKDTVTEDTGIRRTSSDYSIRIMLNTRVSAACGAVLSCKVTSASSHRYLHRIYICNQTISEPDILDEYRYSQDSNNTSHKQTQVAVYSIRITAGLAGESKADRVKFSSGQNAALRADARQLG